MRYGVWLFLVLLATSVRTEPYRQPTIEFEPARLSVDRADYAATYADFRIVSAGLRLSLPVRAFVVELQPGERAESVCFEVGSESIVTNLGSESLQPDITTSETGLYDELLSNQIGSCRLGTEPVSINGHRQIDGRSYVELLLFPAYVDNEGRLLFCSTLYISIGSRHIAPSQLIPAKDIRTSRETSSQRSSSLGTQIFGKYVIITSAELAEAFTPLSRYRTETGYPTEIKTIDEITVSYSGRDDAEKLREYLKVFHAEGGRYVLLGGDETVVPIRYAYFANTNSMPEPDYLQICDLYFSDLTGDWDVDKDGVWGEPYHDQPDLSPELLAGRLPFTTAEEIQQYTRKLITYEMTPGGENREYLTRAFFFSSDQMRDDKDGGQHGQIASAYPNWFTIDTVTGVEAMSGDDPSPTNFGPTELGEHMSDGYGIINVIAHGRQDGFAVKSSGYNAWPKEFLLTEAQSGSHGSFDSIAVSDKPALYYSLACESGRFDDVNPDSVEASVCIAQNLMAQDGGAVAFIGNSRWGWVNSSYLMQKAFFEFLFAHPERPAIEAMYDTKADYSFIRDIVYGQNFFGDPALRVYTNLPRSPSLSVSATTRGLLLSVVSQGESVAECLLVISNSDGLVGSGYTDGAGELALDLHLDPYTLYKISAVKEGMTVGQVTWLGSIATDVETDEPGLPAQFALSQNYPNPFNPATTIEFSLPRTSEVNLSIYNLLGQTVATIVEQTLPTGQHVVEWDGRDSQAQPVASGMYLYRLTAGDLSDVRKMILLR